MRIRLHTRMVAICCVTGLATSQAVSAEVLVDLELRSNVQRVDIGAVIEIGLYAVPNGGSEQTFTGLDVLLAWDPSALELSEGAIDNGPHDWSFIFGFPADETLDRLNADCGKDVFCDSYTGVPFNDGSALFQVASFADALATEDGLLIATFRFNTVGAALETGAVIVAAIGDFSVTRVLQRGAINVTGNLGSSSVTVGPILWAPDVLMPAGRTTEIVVSGDIAGSETYGVTLWVELVSRKGNTGDVIFTAAPPVDVTQRGDPWVGLGTFGPFDTNSPEFSETLNGSIDDNGNFLGESLTYAGLLSAFPVTASADALGVWDIRLCPGRCWVEEGSFWTGTPAVLPTARRHGTLTIVAFADGDGDQDIDFDDYHRFQQCYTGPVGPLPSPAYPAGPPLHCIVLDSDGDGDIDDTDYSAFHGVMVGPGS